MSNNTEGTASATDATTGTSSTNTERAQNRRNDDAGRGNTGGRGNSGRGGRGGRGHTNDRKPGANNASNNISSSNKYKGKTEALNEHCFHTHSENPKRTEFITTLEAIKMYAAKEYKTQFTHMKDSIFEKFEQPVLKPPTKVASTVDEIDKLIYIEDYKIYKKDEKELKNALMTLFDVIIGQCSPLLKSKLKALETWDQMEANSEVGTLLKEIKSVTHQFQSNISIYEALDEAKRQYYTFRHHHEHMTTITFMKTLKNIVDVIEFYGGSISNDPALVKYEKDLDKKNGIHGVTDKEYDQRVRDKVLGVGTLRRADKNMFSHILHDMRNQYQLGNDCYPTTPTKAFDLLQNYHGPTTRSTGNSNGTNALQFAQKTLPPKTTKSQTPIPGTNGKLFPRITCSRCNKLGHYADFCPERIDSSHQQHVMMDDIELHPDSDSDDGSLTHDFTFAHQFHEDNASYHHKILIDSGSSCSVFCDKSLLTNIRPSDEPLTAYTNGGTQESNFCGDFGGFFKVWYNPDCMVNILSWAEIATHFRITSDSAIDDSILVHIADGITIRFSNLQSGIYLLDDNDLPKLSTLTGYIHANIVEDNKLAFTTRELQGADTARSLFKAMGMPSYSRFIYAIENNLIKNCPITVADIRRALHIYGPELATIKGKTTRTKPFSVPASTFTPIPKSVLDHHKHITLAIDFFYVCGIPFLHSISHGYNFRTVESTKNRTKKTMLNGVNKIRQLYLSRGVHISEIRSDGEFQCLESDLLPCKLNVAAPGEHVPEIERSIRTVKEATRTLQYDLPYKKQTKMMTEGNVYTAIKNLNALPALNGVSKTLSPSTLITGKPPLDFDQLLSIKYGEYAQVFTETTNDMSERTVGGIAMYPTGNTQASWYFMSLATGKRITGYQWTVLPITNDVITRVHDLASTQNQERIEEGGNLAFRWRPDDDVMTFIDNFEEEVDQQNSDYVQEEPVENELQDDNPVNTYVEPEVSSHIDNTIPISIDNQVNNNDPINKVIENDKHVQFKERDDIIEIKERSPIESLTRDISELDIDETSSINDDQPNDDVFDTSSDLNILPPEHTIVNDIKHNTTNDDDKEEEPTQASTSLNDSNTAPPSTSPHQYNLRPRKNINYSDSKVGKQFMQTTKLQYPEFNKVKSTKKKAKLNKKKAKSNLVIRDAFKRIVAVCFNQMSAKKGIKKHGQIAINAILQEYKQLHDLGVFKPRYKHELEDQQLKDCLRLITVIKEKRCGKIKGRAVADGRPQRNYIPREEAASPTVSLESLILSLMIDAHEGRDVATADVAGAFLKGDMPDFVLIKLLNEEVDIMCEADNEYKKFITYEGSNKVMYMQLSKALYGCMKSAIIWYNTFTTTLKDLGFRLNPYDPCIANKMINGHQCTIAWYVDDNKISHRDPKVVDSIIAAIEKQHGKMTVCRGLKHVFVGMNIDFLPKGRVQILMKDYLVEAIEDFEEDVTRPATSPACKGLFEVNDKSKPLPKLKAEKFHSIVAKLLYVCIRARLDTSLAVAFLTTRVSKSTEEDWLKLKRLLRYINCTLDLPRIIAADSLNMFKTWVDAAYAVHNDMKSHTGGAMSFGLGVLNAKSRKQRLNVKSSTEAEVVGASDYLPWVVWVSKFMKYQGYNIDSNIFYQDNQSAMKMEKNGRKSCGEKSRHIDIRYFFIKDVILRENITIEYCPTEKMVADFYTKPLQGSLFRKMRDFIMGYTTSLNEERVEKMAFSDNNETRLNMEGDSDIESENIKPSYADIVKGK
jgi:hypothetical protein